MVCMDGFILTHAYERIDVPTQEQVDAFLPAFEPRQVLDPADPMTIGAMVGPEAFTEVKYLAHAKQMQALDVIPEIAAEFEAAFGRDSGGLVRGYRSRGRRDDRRRARLGAGDDRGDDRRDARGGRHDRRPGDQVLPPLPAGGGARGAGRGEAGRRAREGARRRRRRHRLRQRADGALRDPAERLHGDRRPRRTPDHRRTRCMASSPTPSPTASTRSASSTWTGTGSRRS